MPIPIPRRSKRTAVAQMQHARAHQTGKDIAERARIHNLYRALDWARAIRAATPPLTDEELRRVATALMFGGDEG